MNHFNPLSKLALQRGEIENLLQSLTLTFSRSLDTKRKALEPLVILGQQSISHCLNDKEQVLQWLMSQYDLSDPALSLRPKSAMIHKEGKKVALSELAQGDMIVLEDMNTTVLAQVYEKKEFDEIK
jgi:hypothetical protein